MTTHQFVPLPPGIFKPGVIFGMRRILRLCNRPARPAAVIRTAGQSQHCGSGDHRGYSCCYLCVHDAAWPLARHRPQADPADRIRHLALWCLAVIATNTVTRSDEDVTYAVRRILKRPNSTLAGASDMGSTAANFKSDFHTLSQFFACRCRTAVPNRGES